MDKEHINFYEFINNIDDNNIRTTYQNSSEWFEQQLPMDIIDDFYTTPIKMRDYNKAPVIKLKLPVYKNKKSCDIFEHNGIPIDLNMIKKDIEVICILELKGIKYFKQRFECEWNVIQLKAYIDIPKENQCLINEEYLSDYEDSNNNILENQEVENDTDNTELNDTNNKELNDNSNINNTELNDNNTNNNIENVENKQNLENVENKQNLENVENIENVNNKQNLENVENIENNKIKNIELKIDNLDNISELENTDGNSSVISDLTDLSDLSSNNETDYSDYSDLSDYSDSINEDEELICQGLENNLQEVNFGNDSLNDNLNLNQKDTIEEVDLNNINEFNNIDNSDSKDNIDNNKSVEDLMKEIEYLKKLSNEKDDEVNSLKNKYKNLYSELNI